MGGCMDGWADGRMDGCMGGVRIAIPTEATRSVDVIIRFRFAIPVEAILYSHCFLCMFIDPHPPVLLPVLKLRILHMSNQTLARI